MPGETIPLFTMPKEGTNKWVRKAGLHLVVILAVILLLTLYSYLNNDVWELVNTHNGTGSSKSNTGSAFFFYLFAQTATGILLFLLPPIYFSVYFLVPALLQKKRYLLFGLGMVGVAVIWGWFVSFFEPWTDAHWFGMVSEQKNPEDGILVISFLLILTVMINLSYRWFYQQSILKRLENERLNKELSLLKNQINPHFFFNTLNNLYALSLEKSEETPEVILKLSEMMRYAIYECQEPYVPLTSEVKYLESYIALQQIRQHEGTVIFDHELTHSQAMIAPMLLIVFVENAYKHGVDKVTEGSFVRIDLRADKSSINFIIENNFGKSDEATQGGLGLENVKRRLSLIYPDKYQLSARSEGNIFKVSLHIQL